MGWGSFQPSFGARPSVRRHSGMRHLAQTRNLEIPRCATAHLRFASYDAPRNDAQRNQLGNVQLFSSLVAAITSRSSLGPGTAGLDVKMSHWFLILSAGNAV